jgi:hypothetical protein
MNRKQMILWFFLGFVGLAMVAGMIAILLPEKYIRDEIIPTILLVGTYALGGLIVVAINRDMRWTSRIAVGTLLISLIVFLILIWFERSMRGNTEETVFKIGFVFLIAGCVSVHRLLICPLRSSVTVASVCKYASLISGLLTGVLIAVIIISEGFWGLDDFVVRLIGMGLLATAGTSICAGAIAIFGPKPEDEDPGLIDASIPVSMTCPRCRSLVDIHSNKDCRCPSCRLKIRVEVEEPRCSCGYQLYQLDSDTCPECGNMIDEQDRWIDGVEN